MQLQTEYYHLLILVEILTIAMSLQLSFPHPFKAMNARVDWFSLNSCQNNQCFVYDFQLVKR